MTYDYETPNDIVSDAVYLAVGANTLKHNLDKRRDNRALKRRVAQEAKLALAKGEAYDLNLDQLLGLGDGS